MDKAGNRDHAQSLIASYPSGVHLVDGTTLRALRMVPAANASANQILFAAAGTRTAQDLTMTAMINDVNSPVQLSDRPLLTSYCNLIAEILRFFRVLSTCSILHDVILFSILYQSKWLVT